MLAESYIEYKPSVCIAVMCFFKKSHVLVETTWYSSARVIDALSGRLSCKHWNSCDDADFGIVMLNSLSSSSSRSLSLGVSFGMGIPSSYISSSLSGSILTFDSFCFCFFSTCSFLFFAIISFVFALSLAFSSYISFSVIP